MYSVFFQVVASEVLNILHPEPEWLPIFTNVSLLSDIPKAGSENFSFYVPVGRGSVFDDCHRDLKNGITWENYSPSGGSCPLWSSGNGNDDFQAKKGVLVTHKVSRIMPFYFIKNLTKRSIECRDQEDLYNRVSRKSWRNALLNLSNGPRRSAVAEFHLATGHDCLRNHLKYSKLFLLRYALCAALERSWTLHIFYTVLLCSRQLW
ncbi:hypothetical protein TNCV_1460141 [Trichonephila clavipes]|nr:hypothetical protein TNCV_1460141 [Trichonephila clavipes]